MNKLPYLFIFKIISIITIEIDLLALVVLMVVYVGMCSNQTP